MHVQFASPVATTRKMTEKPYRIRNERQGHFGVITKVTTEDVLLRKKGILGTLEDKTGF